MSELEMLAEIVFEKINFGKQFQIYNTFYNKGHQKLLSISAIELINSNNFGYNFGN